MKQLPKKQIRFSQDEINSQVEAIKTLLLKAKANKQTITVDEISTITGINRGTILNRIRENQELLSLRFWTKATDTPIYDKEEISSQNQQIAYLLSSRMRYSDIAKITGLSASCVKKRTDKDINLSNAKNFAMQQKTLSDEKDKIQVEKFLKLIKRRRKKTTLEKISTSTGVSKSRIENFIEEDENIKALWNSTKSQTLSAFSQDDIKKQARYFKYSPWSKSAKSKNNHCSSCARIKP